MICPHLFIITPPSVYLYETTASKLSFYHHIKQVFASIISSSFHINNVHSLNNIYTLHGQKRATISDFLFEEVYGFLLPRVSLPGWIQQLVEGTKDGLGWNMSKLFVHSKNRIKLDFLTFTIINILNKSQAIFNLNYSRSVNRTIIRTATQTELTAAGVHMWGQIDNIKLICHIQETFE